MAVTIVTYGLYGRVDAAFTGKKKAIAYVNSLQYVFEKIDNDAMSTWFKSMEDMNNPDAHDYYKVIKLDIE